mgnify:CR=1 FL=1
MKKNTITLDLDPQAGRWDGIALILFHSIAPNYAFVDDLNHLYNLRLSRIEDLELNDLQWPLFSFNDTLRHLRYFVIERPASTTGAAPMWTPGHKMMILIGQQAEQQAKTIHDEFSSATTPDDPNDIIAAQHTKLLDNIRSDFTTTTLLDPTAPPPASLRGKALRDYNDLFALADTIVETMDIKYKIYTTDAW